MSKRTRQSHLPNHHNQLVQFVHREDMARKTPINKAGFRTAPPVTQLPCDCTGNATVSAPMDKNDSLGICGPAMCAHVSGIWTYGQGNPGFTEVIPDVSKLVAQYEQVSGGDNGTSEDELVGAEGIWDIGLAGDPSLVIEDHLDIDLTNVQLTQYCIDQFYAVEMGWSVPDDFINTFTSGASYLNAMTPDPNNGHWSPLSDIDQNGVYRVWTWGTWAWMGPACVASVQPSGFVAFSALQFNKQTGYDSKSRHVSDQAQKWVAIGGDPGIAEKVVAMFPAKAEESKAASPPVIQPSDDFVMGPVRSTPES